MQARNVVDYIFFNKDNKYCGYLTLRPTKHYFNFSKSFLNPELLLESPA